MNKPIYLDYNATTPIAPEVAEAMMPYLFEYFGNPSSSHGYGIESKKAVEIARVEVANLLCCSPLNIVFTSGGTESNNYAIQGTAFANRHKGNHIITSAVEHPAVSEVCNWLVSQGFELSILPVDHYGLVNPADLEKTIIPETILVTIMHANNEVGTIQPIKKLAAIAHRYNIIFHTDAAQSVGKIPVNVNTLGVDLLSLAGHKLYAPKGVGALYVRENVELKNLMFGANHENGRRPGTENVLEIVGLGEACALATRDLDKLQHQLQDSRDILFEGLIKTLGRENIRLNNPLSQSLPNTLSIGFRNIAANELLNRIQNKVAASAGSACHADQVRVSDVLKAMDVPLEFAMGTVRFSVGRGTTRENISQAIKVIIEAVQYFNPPNFTMEAS
jgi:cysteine desulfurase NifS